MQISLERLNLFQNYTTQILNIANKNSKGTAPAVVGQMSELIQKCPYNQYSKWKQWYLSNQPEGIDKATKKIIPMIENMKDAINKIDENMVRLWVEDLVIDKTFVGLKFQEAILKRVSKLKNKIYRPSNPQEESKGIDGFIDNVPVSVKPITYKIKDMLNEQINVKIIFYEKKKDGLKVDISQLE